MVITAYAVIKLSSDVPGCNEEHTTLAIFSFLLLCFVPRFVFYINKKYYHAFSVGCHHQPIEVSDGALVKVCC